MDKIVGRRSVQFEIPPCIVGAASVAGEKEGNGAFGKYFDIVETDPLFGGNTWEEAESKMQHIAADIAIRNAGLEPEDIRYIIAGDLLGQLIATSFGIMNFNIPMFGVYGACSTMGGLCRGADFQPLCECGKAVSLSISIWQSKAVLFDMDGDGERRRRFGQRERELETERDELCGDQRDHYRDHYGLWH